MSARIPSVETHNLTIGYRLKSGKKKVIHENLSLSLYPGEVTCLLGLNGAGKSTLLKTLCGFLPPLGGEVRIQGKSLAAYTQHQFALLVGVVLTDKTNAGGITVYELVSLGRHPYTGFFGQLKENDHRIIRSALEAAGISHKAGQYVSELSDGERQKAMIAKALAQECPIILLDEPTAFLDITSRIETMALLRRLAVTQNKTILLSTHDLEQAVQMADCLWLQSRENPVICGTPEDLILSGSFGSFFEKENIRFDPASGKLNMHIQRKPVGITGNPLVAYWTGNALLRNGYLSGPAQPGTITVNCISSDNLEIIHPSGEKKTVADIAALIEYMRSSSLQ